MIIHNKLLVMYMKHTLDLDEYYIVYSDHFPKYLILVFIV